MAGEIKDTNPKDAVGTRKWRQYCTVPATVLWEVGVGMLEGARKYGRHNYRVSGVRASVYVDAAKGHIDQWWEGEDIDADSRLSHITKAICSLMVLRDSMIQEMFVDDRPPKAKMDKVREELQVVVESIMDEWPDAQTPYLETTHPNAPSSSVAEPDPSSTGTHAEDILTDIEEWLGKPLSEGFSGRAVAIQRAYRAMPAAHRAGVSGWHQLPAQHLPAYETELVRASEGTYVPPLR